MLIKTHDPLFALINEQNYLLCLHQNLLAIETARALIICNSMGKTKSYIINGNRLIIFITSAGNDDFIKTYANLFAVTDKKDTLIGIFDNLSPAIEIKKHLDCSIIPFNRLALYNGEK
jgi:hypothetical protein